MHKQLLTTLAIAFCGSGIASLPLTANAQTLLTRATVRDLQNQVELFLKDQAKPRLAKKADNMTPGDSLQTYRQAMAELRFNDNSLARIGEQAIFRFIPNTRNLNLQKGTVLLLIPPGQGRTQVKTPNAVAGIRGSALFVRYIEDTGVTIVGALTDSAIEVSNADGSQTYVLKAGQIGTVYKNQIGVYDFDLKAFYETSLLVKNIDMQGLEAVGQEMAAPQKAQIFANNKPESVLNTPAWVQSAENRPGSPLPIATSGNPTTLLPTNSDPNKSAYEWSAVLKTLKQYSNPVAQSFPLPAAISPQLPLASDVPGQPAIPTQVSTSAISAPPTLQNSAAATPSSTIGTPATPSTFAPAPPTPQNPAAATPPSTIGTPATPPTFAPAPPTPQNPAAATPPSTIGTPATPPTVVPAPPVPAAIQPATPPSTVGTPATPPTFAPAPPVPPAIQPATPPLTPAAPPVVAPPQTAVISTPAISVPVAVPVVPAIPVTPTIPSVPVTPAIPSVPATPPATPVVTAPQVTPNLDLPSVQPGSGATPTAPTTTPPASNSTTARPVP